MALSTMGQVTLSFASGISTGQVCSLRFVANPANSSWVFNSEL